MSKQKDLFFKGLLLVDAFSILKLHFEAFQMAKERDQENKTGFTRKLTFGTKTCWLSSSWVNKLGEKAFTEARTFALKFPPEI